jgi:thioredoxin-related protein
VPKIQWHQDLQKALAQARKQNKLLFVHFYTESCPFCQKMQQKTFPHVKVRRELQHFVAAKINLSQNQDLTQRFEVKGVPDNRVYAPKEESLVMHLAGFSEAESFSSHLQKTRHHYAAGQQLLARYQSAQGQQKPQIALKLGRYHYNLEKYRKAINFFEQSPIARLSNGQSPEQKPKQDSQRTQKPKDAQKTDPIVDYHKEFGFSLMAMGRYHRAEQHYRFFLDNAKRRHPSYDYVRLLLAFSQINLGHKNKAIKNLDLILTEGSSPAIKKEARSLKQRIQGNSSGKTGPAGEGAGK